MTGHMCNKHPNYQGMTLVFKSKLKLIKNHIHITHTNMDPRADRDNELYHLGDGTKVEEWRKETGLEPLRQYLNRTCIKYKPGAMTK